MAEESSPVPPTPEDVPPGPDLSKSSSSKLRKDRRPLPLLSRRKLKPPRELTPSGESEGVPASTTKRRRARKAHPLWAKILLRVVAYGSLYGLGVLAYQQFRQTTVLGRVSFPGAELPREVYLVRDFTSDVRALRQEYFLARDPFLSELKAHRATLVQIHSDLGALEERERLLQDQIAESKTETSAIIEEARKAEAKVWEDNAKPMEEEYDRRLGALGTAIASRAKSLGLTYEVDPEMKSPEVWANAYRLSLYAPPKDLKTADERLWVEAQLKEWNDFEASQAAKREALKAQVEAIHKGIAPKIAAVDDRERQAQTRIAETEEEAKPIRDELEVVTGQEAAAKASAEEEQVKYQKQMLELPSRNILDKIPLGSDGRWNLGQLDQNSQFPPGGNYLLLVSVKKQGEDFWALVPFTPQQYSIHAIVVKEMAFLRARSFLE